MIKFNEKLKTFTLETKKSSYQMKVDELGYLLHTWYGKKIDANDDLSDVILKVDRGFSVLFFSLSIESTAVALRCSSEPK